VGRLRLAHDPLSDAPDLHDVLHRQQLHDLVRVKEARRRTSVQVTTPTFTAGLVIYRGEVVTCSPILKRWVGVRRAADALDRLRVQGWRVEFITNNGEGTERR
jgi:hypothetical protein